MSKTNYSILGVLVALALFFAVNLASGAIFKSSRIDLTENKLYTLSEGTKNVLRGLEEPITLRLYFSRTVANETSGLTHITDYAKRVEEMLQEYESYAGGKLDLYVIEPEPFSEEEDRAVAYGLQGAALSRGSDPLYFGLVGTNTTDDEEVIPFFQLARQEFLEYDLTRLVYSLGYSNEAVVGLLSTLPIEGGAFNPMNPQEQPEPWFIADYLRELSDVRTISPRDTEIPEEIEVLVLVHPKELSQDLLYAIDQFVLRGGKLIAFLDPHCEADPVPQDPNNPLAGMQANRSSYLDPLLAAWGVKMEKDRVVGDRQNAITVRPGNELVDYVVFLTFGPEACDSDDPITAELDRLRMASAGAFQPIDGATTTFDPILRSSEDSMLIDRMNVALYPDPKRLLNDFVPSGQRFALAARVSGPAKSAYPDGDPTPDEDEDEVPTNGEGQEETEDEESEAEGAAHLAESQGGINVLLVADADMLADRWWVQPINFLGNRYFNPTADNGDFAVNAVENMSGSSDLISLRSRPSFERPFTVVADIRREAEERFRAQEQELEQKLQEIDKRINDLQAQKDDGVSSMILTPEQREQLELAREEQLSTRKKLREVKHSLQKEIESLGTWLKFLNILVIPLALAALALAGGVIRSRRSRD